MKCRSTFTCEKKQDPVSPRIEEIPLSKFDLSLSEMRVMNIARVAQVEKSMRMHGQLQTVVARLCNGSFQMIDGFKRLYVAQDLMLETLQCRVLEIDLQQAKVLLLSYNHSNQSMQVWEEAIVLKDLQKTHDLDQPRLAKLTGYSPSWVSRRLALIDKIDEGVSVEIRMGTLTSSHARALIRLPRGKQCEVARVIIAHGLPSRLSNTLIDAFLAAKDEYEQRDILAHPYQVLEKRGSVTIAEGNDTRLSGYGNDLAKSINRVIESVQILLSRLDDHRLGEINQAEKLIIIPGLKKALSYAQRLTIPSHEQSTQDER